MDIRKFFNASGGGGSGDGKKRSTEGEAAGAPAAKKSKAADGAATAAKPAPTPKKTAAKGTSRGTKASPASSKGKGSASAGRSRKRPVVLSDSEDDKESDFKPESEDEEGGSDFEIDLVSSDEDEALAKKKPAAQSPAAKTAKLAAPATDKKPGKRGAKKAARAEIVITPHSPKKKAAADEKAEAAASPVSATKRAVPKSFSRAAPKDEDEAVPKPPAPKKAAATPKAASKQPVRKRTPKGKKPDPYEHLSQDARDAMAAVEQAMKELPPLEDVKMSVFEGDGGFGARPADEPPNAGSKEAPRGHPDCLTGKAFVISGVLDSLRREDAEDFIRRHGGRLTGSVSGKTNFLLVGTQCGTSKLKSAEEKETKVIDEDGLFSLVAATAHLAGAAQPAEPGPTAMDLEPPQPAGTTAAATAAGAAAGPSRPAGASQPAAPLGGPKGVRPSAPAQPRGPGSGDLWVEKHKPRHSRELVGNNTLIATLRQWLQNWEAVNIRGAAPEDAKSKGKNKDMSKKAVLLSGPPGIGKSSSAMIISRELGFLPVEVNASDTRNKSDAKVKAGIGGKLSNAIRELATNSAIGTGDDGRPKRTVLIMDEVDGMSAGDRGGVADLIVTIAKSKIPIIAICNDKYNQKLKSLRNHCLELEYRRPTSQQIVARMMNVARAEGLQINEASMRMLVEGAHGDLRLLLGQMQMVRLSAAAMQYDDVKRQALNAKDADMSPFEAARKLLDADSAKLSISAKSDLVFQDMDLVPLLIQENYLNHKPAAGGNELQHMKLMAQAADALSLGDNVTRQVRQYQNWSLMPFAAVIGSVYPATYVRGNRVGFGLYPGETNFPRFSAWFGANSSSGKQRRLLGELHTRLAASGNFHSDRSTLRLQYASAWRRTLVKPLLDRQEEGIPDVIQDMHDYCMARDDLDYVLDVTKFKTKGSWNEDPLKSVPTALKSAFTRAFNKDKVAPRTNIMVDEFKPGRGRGAAAKGGRRKAPAAAAADGDGVLRESEEEAAEAAAAAKVEEEPEEEEEEEEDEAAMQRRLAGGGLHFSAAGGSGKGGRGRGRGGRGGGRAGRGGGRGRGRK